MKTIWSLYSEMGSTLGSTADVTNIEFNSLIFLCYFITNNIERKGIYSENR